MFLVQFKSYLLKKSYSVAVFDIFVDIHFYYACIWFGQCSNKIFEGYGVNLARALYIMFYCVVLLLLSIFCDIIPMSIFYDPFTMYVQVKEPFQSTPSTGIRAGMQFSEERNCVPCLAVIKLLVGMSWDFKEHY